LENHELAGLVDALGQFIEGGDELPCAGRRHNKARPKESPKAIVQLTSPRGNHPRAMFVSRFRARVQTRFDNIDHTRHAHMSLPTQKKTDRSQP
jgi:hypothetical protein